MRLKFCKPPKASWTFTASYLKGSTFASMGLEGFKAEMKLYELRQTYKPKPQPPLISTRFLTKQSHKKYKKMKYIQ